MEQHLSSIRAEVLRQLIGASTGWFVKILLVLALYWILFFVYESLVDGTLYERLKLVGRALFKNERFKLKSPSSAPFAYFVLSMILVACGYSLGYTIATNYISGEITLISTVSRITGFYTLTVVVFEMLLTTFASLILLSAASSIRKNGLEVYKTSKLAKFNLSMLQLVRLCGILIAVVLGIASMVFCYMAIH